MVRVSYSFGGRAQVGARRCAARACRVLVNARTTEALRGARAQPAPRSSSSPSYPPHPRPLAHPYSRRPFSRPPPPNLIKHLHLFSVIPTRSPSQPYADNVALFTNYFTLSPSLSFFKLIYISSYLSLSHIYIYVNQLLTQCTIRNIHLHVESYQIYCPEFLRKIPNFYNNLLKSSLIFLDVG